MHPFYVQHEIFVLLGRPYNTNGIAMANKSCFRFFPGVFHRVYIDPGNGVFLIFGVGLNVRELAKNNHPSCLFFCPFFALHQWLHNAAMRPLTRLENEQNYCANMDNYFFHLPK